MCTDTYIYISGLEVCGLVDGGHYIGVDVVVQLLREHVSDLCIST